MITGWILLSCALIILVIMAFAPPRRNEQLRTMEKQIAGPETEGRIYAARDPSEEVRQMLQQGEKIKAIKLYREQTGVGLREAKETIDRLEQA